MPFFLTGSGLLYKMWPFKWFFSNNELLIILNRKNLEYASIRVFNYWRNCIWNLEKSNAHRFLHSWALKWYEACRTKKSFRGQILYRSPNPVKKRRHRGYYIYIPPCIIYIGVRLRGKKIIKIFKKKCPLSLIFPTLSF